MPIIINSDKSCLILLEAQLDPKSGEDPNGTLWKRKPFFSFTVLTLESHCSIPPKHPQVVKEYLVPIGPVLLLLAISQLSKQKFHSPITLLDRGWKPEQV